MKSCMIMDPRFAPRAADMELGDAQGSHTELK